MTANTKDLERAIKDLLKVRGFEQKGTSWYLETPESICLLNLQKSSWGGQFYINLGVFLKQLDSIAFPKEHQCHIRGRLSSIVPDRARIEKCLDFEDNTFSTEERMREITKAVEEEAIPLLLSLTSLDGIKNFIQSEQSEEFAVSLKVRDLLGIAD